MPTTMNKITVYFSTCSPAPSGGYKIYYRVSGTTDDYTYAGTFFISPAIFYDTINLPETCYEGYIVADCGNGVLGNGIPFESCGSSGESGGGEITHELNIRLMSGQTYFDSLAAACAAMVSVGCGSNAGTSVFVRDGTDWITYNVPAPVTAYESDQTTIVHDNSIPHFSNKFRVVSDDGGGTCYVVLWQTDGSGIVSIMKQNC